MWKASKRRGSDEKGRSDGKNCRAAGSRSLVRTWTLRGEKSPCGGFPVTGSSLHVPRVSDAAVCSLRPYSGIMRRVPDSFTLAAAVAYIAFQRVCGHCRFVESSKQRGTLTDEERSEGIRSLPCVLSDLIAALCGVCRITSPLPLVVAYITFLRACGALPLCGKLQAAGSTDR